MKTPSVVATITRQRMRVSSEVPIRMDAPGRALRLIPNAECIELVDEHTVELALGPFPGPYRADSQAAICLTEVNSVGIGDLAYGFLRFLHAQHSAQNGLVVVDGGAILSKVEVGVATLIIGAGKSTLAWRAKGLGLEILSDDSLFLDFPEGLPRVSSISGHEIISRSGLSAPAGPRVVASARLSGCILIQASFGTGMVVQHASTEDRSSWCWRAIATRLLNSSCFPITFERPYSPILNRSIEDTMVRAHRVLIDLPMAHVLGEPAAVALLELLEG